jgi:uncharacterized protein (TIGR02246 family)
MRALGMSVLALALWASVARAQADLGEAAEERAVRAVADRFGAAWNRHDAKAMAATFAADGDIVNPYGEVVKGRPALEALFAREQAGFARSSRFASTVESLRFLKPDIALVDGTVTVSGVRGDGADAPAATLKGRYTDIVAKREGQWLVLARRVMLIVPEPGTSPDRPAPR